MRPNIVEILNGTSTNDPKKHSSNATDFELKNLPKINNNIKKFAGQ